MPAGSAEPTQIKSDSAKPKKFFESLEGKITYVKALVVVARWTHRMSGSGSSSVRTRRSNPRFSLPALKDPRVSRPNNKLNIKKNMDKEKIIEKLEERIWQSNCSSFEPSICPACMRTFNWLVKTIKN